MLATMAKRPPERWVEKGPLAPWMIAYAKWLAGEPGAELTTQGESGYRSRYPTGEERSRRCSEYAGRQVQRTLVPLVEKRQDFKDYFEKLRADTAFHAKELARDQIAENFGARAEGLKLARQKKDHREIERYTRPFLDHALPKKESEVQPVQKFTINLFGASPEQKKLLHQALLPEPLDEIEFEVIETEKTESEED